MAKTRHKHGFKKDMGKEGFEDIYRYNESSYGHLTDEAMNELDNLGEPDKTLIEEIRDFFRRDLFYSCKRKRYRSLKDCEE